MSAAVLLLLRLAERRDCWRRAARTERDAAAAACVTLLGAALEARGTALGLRGGAAWLRRVENPKAQQHACN